VQARAEEDRPTLALIGLRCSGKSTLAREVARELGAICLDLDEAVVIGARGAGLVQGHSSAGELLAKLGEQRFRNLESKGLQFALSKAFETPIVLATGGGVVEREDNRELLASRALCVWLRADLETLRSRLRADRTLRPALGGSDAAVELDELARRRDPWYASLAQLELDTTHVPPTVLATHLLAALDPQALPRFRLLRA
jgi:shikimate kinase